MSEPLPFASDPTVPLSVVPWSPSTRQHHLVKAIGRIHAERDEPGVLLAAVQAVERTIPGAASALFQVDPDVQVVSLRAAGPRWRTAERDAPAWLTGETGGIADFARGAGACAGRLWRQPGCAIDRDCDIARVRVMSGDSLWGMLVVVGPSSRTDRREDVWFVEALATHVGLALRDAAERGALLRALAAARAAHDRSSGDVQHRMLGQLAAGIGHEFNNTLTSILGVTEWLLYERPGDSELAQELGTMRESANAAATLIRRLRYFGRRTGAAAREATSLDSLVVECLDVVRPYLFEFNERERVNVRVTIDCEDDPLVAVDTAGLREAIVNLLTNAIDASASGGDIVVQVGREQQEAFVSVIDHGMGMGAGTRQRVFEPFFSTKGRRSAGLGLPLCLSVVESHGGRLAVASTHGVGSTFTVWLPVADEPEQLPGVASAGPPGPIA